MNRYPWALRWRIWHAVNLRRIQDAARKASATVKAQRQAIAGFGTAEKRTQQLLTGMREILGAVERSNAYLEKESLSPSGADYDSLQLQVSVLAQRAMEGLE